MSLAETEGIFSFYFPFRPEQNNLNIIGGFITMEFRFETVELKMNLLKNREKGVKN